MLTGEKKHATKKNKMYKAIKVDDQTLRVWSKCTVRASSKKEQDTNYPGTIIIQRNKKIIQSK